MNHIGINYVVGKKAVPEGYTLCDSTYIRHMENKTSVMENRLVLRYRGRMNNM